MRFVADFETTTVSPARVWLWGIVGVDTAEPEEETGDSIESFFEHLEKMPKNPLVYFHNLKFDGYFILDFLLRNGFEWVPDESEVKDKTFTCIIDEFNEFYQIAVYFKKNPKTKKVKKATFWDSMKKIKFPVKDIPKKFGFTDVKKGSIDYSRHNEPCFITDEERRYCLDDCRIVARAMRILYAVGCDKMTIALCALNDYKTKIGKNNFKMWFPSLPYEVDCEIRQAFRGGWCYVNPEYLGRDIQYGFVLDQNSKYGNVMKTMQLPFGPPIRFEGKYQGFAEYPLYIQHFRCIFRLKNGKLPFIQIKRTPEFMPTEYVRDSEILVDLWLCSPEIELFFDHYEVSNIEYIDGYMFQSSTELFRGYVEKWNALKEEGETTGNKGMRMLAKQMIVSLYGKFSRSPERKSCYPVLNPESDQIALHPILFEETDENGCPIMTVYTDPETGEEYEAPRMTDTEIVAAGYIPLSCFVTSWGRAEEIKAAQIIVDTTKTEDGRSAFLYGDTDSLHLALDFIPDFLEMDQAKLGAWKIENCILRGRYLQSKRYILEVQDTFGNRKTKCVCSGMPADVQERCNFDNFSMNAVFHGRKIPVIVPGGVILKEHVFSLKGRF